MTISMADAAYQVLKNRGVALHYTDITQEAIRRGLISPEGLTPEASINAAIYRKNKSLENRGELPIFDPLGEGIYGLTEWKPIGLRKQIQDKNRDNRKQLHELISSMPPDKFEKVIGVLLLALDFGEDSVQVTGRTGDGGVDVIGTISIGEVLNVQVAAQVKRTQASISPEKVRALRGSLLPDQRGIFITTSKFTRSATEEASAIGKVPISLVDGEKLISLLFKHKIGINSEQFELYAIDPEFWTDNLSTNVQISTDGKPRSEKVHVNYPMAIFAIHRGIRHDAMLAENGEVKIGDRIYPSVSLACRVVTGWKAGNGWRFWSFTNPTDGRDYPIDFLRKDKS